MKIVLLILLLFATAIETKSQAVPRFLWNPVVKPYEFVPNPDNNDTRQKGFNSNSNTSQPYTMGTPYLVTEVGSVTIGGKKVNTTDTFWVYPYTSNDRVGLSAKQPFVIESILMNRSYTNPDTNKLVFLTDQPNQHSNNSGVRPYNPLDRLLFAEMYGNYFIKSEVNLTNQGAANLNVVDSAFGSPINASNLVSTRNIEEVMKLGDFRMKVRMMNRMPHLHASYMYMNINGVLVQ
ncbi:hypothetical protein [uncultured Maribacter sp.]|uniref:hypothetical protein n=1 Tax=uncultured Maribacter sp. TaxID=431308 RepID=UPI0030D94F16